MLSLAPWLLAVLLIASPVLAAEDGKPAAAAISWNVPVLLVRDLDRAAAWYQEHFGFERVSDRQDGTSRSIVLSRGPTLVHLRAQAADVTGSVGQAGPAPRSRLMLAVDDIDAVVAELEDNDLNVVALPQDDLDGRKRTATFADPDGNLVVLEEILPASS